MPAGGGYFTSIILKEIKWLSEPNTFSLIALFQVGSFNFDNRKMVFDRYLLPTMPNHTKSILDYDVIISELRPEATFFVPAETGELNSLRFVFRQWWLHACMATLPAAAIEKATFQDKQTIDCSEIKTKTYFC